MKLLTPLTFEQARQCVLERAQGLRRPRRSEAVSLLQAQGRVLAEAIHADRDYPPVARSARDGFAVRAGDGPGPLRVIGEVRAGETFRGAVGAGEAVEIMTGAPVPDGADAVVMVERVSRDGDRVILGRPVERGEAIQPRGVEARRGDAVLEAGVRIGYAEIALLATVGRAAVRVYERPAIGILATGDEIVPVEATPRDCQVRNGNAHSLAAQVERAGGLPTILPVARDTVEATRKLVDDGLETDLLLLSGGVSAGKYDFVERALQDAGAEFFFDRVLIQPGQPLVFGHARGRMVFGLPGNPVSTMVTFEAFARAAIELLCGQRETMLPLGASRLTEPFRHKPGLTRFLPAKVSADGAAVTPVAWRGSGDIAGLAKGNAFLKADADRAEWDAGDWMQVLMR